MNGKVSCPGGGVPRIDRGGIASGIYKKDEKGRLGIHVILIDCKLRCSSFCVDMKSSLSIEP